MKNDYIIILFLGIVLLVVGFFVLKPSKQKKDREEKEEKRKDEVKEVEYSSELKVVKMKQILLNNKLFKPSYHKNFDQSIYYVNNYAYMIKELKQELHSILEIIGTDEGQILDIFGQLTHKAQVSFLASEYSKKYDRSLRSDLIEEDLPDRTLVLMFNIFQNYI